MNVKSPALYEGPRTEAGGREPGHWALLSDLKKAVDSLLKEHGIEGDLDPMRHFQALAKPEWWVRGMPRIPVRCEGELSFVPHEWATHVLYRVKAGQYLARLVSEEPRREKLDSRVQEVLEIMGGSSRRWLLCYGWKLDDLES